jgi:hypothetical protein
MLKHADVEIPAMTVPSPSRESRRTGKGTDCSWRITDI